MKLDEALEHALKGDALLFLGAAFSKGATNSYGENFKTASEFSAHLKSKLGDASSGVTELPDVSEEYAGVFGDSDLHKELIKDFRATKVSQSQIDIATVPWQRVYTTNYDNVYEFASSVAKIPVKPVTLSEHTRNFGQYEFLCVHLNGFIERLTDHRGDEIRLTDTSYLTSSIENSPWAAVLRHDISRAKAVFFIGYSASDLDIARILAATGSLQDKTFFIVGTSPSAKTINKTSRFGTVEKIDSERFALEIKAKRSRYTLPENIPPVWFCLEKYNPTLLDAESESDSAVFNLVLRGIVDRRLLSSSVQSNTNSYVVRREVSENALKQAQDTTKAIVLNSLLGNGKTIVLETIKVMAHSQGLPIYSLVQRSPYITDELFYLSRLETPFLLVVDDYPKWLDVMTFFSSHENKYMSLILSARTTHHDVLSDRLQKILKGRAVKEYSVDAMIDEELVSTDAFFQKYGMWGDKAGLSVERRIAGLKDICYSEWQSILAELFKAPQIQSRFVEVLAKLEQAGNFQDILLGILALTVISENVTIDMLIDIFGSRVLDSAFQRDENVREFIDFQKGEVLSRSSVAARFLLSRVADPKGIVDVVAFMAKSLDKQTHLGPQYQETMRSLIKFSQLEHILPFRNTTELRDASFKYYEQVKNLEYCRESPQFWLQYAIAALVFGELERAERYFKTAYSLAENKPYTYDTSKIDNHYARLLLTKATNARTKLDAMEHYLEARRILLAQIQTETLHYPYRVAIGFEDFTNKFRKDFSPEEFKELQDSAVFVEKRILSLPPEIQKNPHIDACLKAMRRIRAGKQ